MNGLNVVCVGYNFTFGASAISLSESEHLLAAMQYAIDNKVDCFISFYCSGGMDVKGNLFSLTKGMSAIIMAMNEMKRKNILTVGVLSSKTTGGLLLTLLQTILFGQKVRTQTIYYFREKSFCRCKIL